ncbi:HAD family hydrolase [Demequina activiva]|uniref:Phosphoglycolate phosphatase n=1 Tax=Demequina activiva TaxID=1582364 RepID=A0A919Q543_9MICO|nr:HAD family phosphatase [Demequina activiva]GIG54453.1 phosphoglycolate phosphatase [Demequina activiva]
MNQQHSLPAAVLWDLDGTLIDSEPFWFASERALAARFGATWSDADAHAQIGAELTVTARSLRDAGVDLPVPDIIELLVAEVAEKVRTSAPWNADARALLERVVAAGIPCALVTMSYSRLAQAFLATAPDAFAVVVTGDRVAHGKPHPEPYLTAAAELGVPIAQCVAVEDSPTGVASALAAGARTVGVERIVPLDPRPGLARVRSLEGLGPEDLLTVHDHGRPARS